MQTISVDKYNMHFNSDLSGTVKIEIQNDEKFEIPGELIRQYVRKYVLAPMRDECSDMLYRQLSNFGGIDKPDYMQILERIDNLQPISEDKDPACVLHGTTYLVGQYVHVEFLRVTKESDGSLTTEDPAYQEELEHVQAASRSQGTLSTIMVPGYTGDYIAFTYPHTD